LGVPITVSITVLIISSARSAIYSIFPQPRVFIAGLAGAGFRGFGGFFRWFLGHEGSPLARKNPRLWRGFGFAYRTLMEPDCQHCTKGQWGGSFYPPGYEALEAFLEVMQA
jgi:hypothetical protein